MKAVMIAMAALALLNVQPAAAEQRPQSIEAVAWLVGSWHGEGIGRAAAIEVYSPPADGQLIGHFRQLNPDGSVMFYELITIAVRDGTLFYRLKHFNPDLTGWEDKDETEEFSLTYAGRDRWESPGFVIERPSENRMRMTVAIRGDNGNQETLVFNFTRQ